MSAAPRPRQHYNVTLAILVFAGTAFALQQTMIIPALPVLRDELGTTTEWATWLLTGFLLSASVAIPILGKLGDQHGKERLLVISLGVFLLGSIGACFAWDIGSLIGLRILQGAGGAVFPLSFSIIKDEFPPEKVGVAVGAVSSVFAVGGSLGLVLSGLIVDNLSWRWLFGVGAVGVAIAVVLVAWGFVELRVPEPMVDMRMLADRQVLFTNLTALVGGFALFGSFILIPNLLQLPREVVAYGFGASATLTGLYLLPSAVTGFASGPLAGVMSRHVHAKWPLSLGMALGGIGLRFIAVWHSEGWHIVLGMLVLGAGLPMTFAAMAKIIVDVVRPTETGVATGMNTVMRTIGGVVGGQVVAALLAAETIGAAGVPAESAFVTAFWVGAGRGP